MTNDKAKRAARQRRQDAKRERPISLRLNPVERAWLDEAKRESEGDSTAVKRLAGFPQRSS